MSSESSPVKVTLGMIKGKPIAMSNPVIRYRVNDDELEELYASTDDEKLLTPESEQTSPRPSPRKSRISISDSGDLCEGSLEKRSTSMDDNLSESASQSDPWKVLSKIKGKITQTFEDKLTEMKNERKKSRHDRSRDTSSVSDYEDLGDVTPTKELSSEKQEKDSHSSTGKKHSHSSRFGSFSHIKTGLKTKKSEDDSVESGIEAAELTYECQNQEGDLCFDREKNLISTSSMAKNENTEYALIPEILRPVHKISSDSDHFLILLRNLLYYQLPILLAVLCSCYFVPLPEYPMGILAGIIVSFMCHKIYTSVEKVLVTSTVPTITKTPIIPVVEIQAVKEHAVLEKFEGWLNELPYKYEHFNYHLARTRPVFFKLEGDILQIMETRTRIPKRAVWDETKHKPKFTKRRVYSLAGAKIELLPSGLIRLRRWSKKYPICITLEKDILKENTLIDTNSSDDEAQPLDNDSEKIIAEEEETDDDISQSRDCKDVFEDCQDDNDDEGMKVKLYVFARTDRQKEDWFRRLAAASRHESKRSSISSAKDIVLPGNSQSQTNNEKKASTPSIATSEMPSVLSYKAYMTRYVDAQPTPTTETNISSGISHDGFWINALLGRILFDMHKCPETINVIQDKIQRKLSNIKLPYFMESLLVSELVIGQGAPIIHSATRPVMDDRGIWFDLDITYEGSLTMTIETKLNLMKLKRTSSVPSNSNEMLKPQEGTKPLRSPMFDSDVEDSPETSTEDEDSPPLTAAPSSRENTPTQSSGKKFLSMVDKLASNKYFQHATELSYVKRAMEGVSNTEIRLTVSVSSIEGCLSVNIPPPPSDRLWYGFKPVPKIYLTAKPAVGERAFNIVYVTKWIETKLLKEFEKIVVIPNMDDLVIPLCPNYPFSS